MTRVGVKPQYLMLYQCGSLRDPRSPLKKTIRVLLWPKLGQPSRIYQGEVFRKYFVIKTTKQKPNTTKLGVRINLRNQIWPSAGVQQQILSCFLLELYQFRKQPLAIEPTSAFSRVD